MLKKTKTVLLYHPKIDKLVDNKPGAPPYSLLTLAGPLLEKGYDVKIFDALADKGAQEKVLENLDGAICVGFSVWTGFPIADSLELSKKIKKANPNIPIVWGGWHPSILPLQTIKNPNIDVVVRGQGEVTFLELVKCLEKKDSLKKIQGVTYKSNGKIFTNPARLRTPLDDLPPVPYHLIDLEKYITNMIGKRTISYISSQGCPYDCAFCADSLVYKRKRMDLSAENTIRDIKFFIEKYNVDSVIFHDSNFFVKKEKVKKICQAMIKNKWNIRWAGYERTSHFLTYDENMIKLIKDSGCCLLVVGAESGSQKILDFLSKGIKVEDTIEFSKLCKKHGISVLYDIMVGFPNETEEDFQKTLNLIKEVYKIDKNNDTCTQFYTPYPGTPLYNKMIKEYCFKPPKSLNEWSEYDPSISNMTWVDGKYKEKLRMFLFYLQFAFLNKHFKKRIEKSKFKFLMWSMHKIALLRFKTNFFKFPLEKKMYEILRRIK